MTPTAQLTPGAYEAAAWLLRCEVRALKAIAQVEAGPLGAFLPGGEPVILYEPHVFDRLTKGAHRGARAAHVDPRFSELSVAEWTPGIYGVNSLQHDKLAAAVKLNHEAALKACSWGLFQIMGHNHVAAGFAPVGMVGLQRFINAMYRSADDHLRALVMYIRADARLVDAIREKDFAKFALVYNGTGYKRNKYDEKMAAAYLELR